MATIALIEDEALLRELFEQRLQKAGHIVQTATNGKEGWQLIQDQRPDLVLLDLLMPLMSGYDVLTAMRANKEFKATPVLVISNSGQINDLNRAYECGADDVLIKADFNPDQLLHKVEELLARQAKDTDPRLRSMVPKDVVESVVTTEPEAADPEV